MKEYRKRSIAESIAECEELKKTGKLDEPFADGDFKIGDLKPCNKCGKPAEVVCYQGLGQFSKSVLSTCVDCKEPYEVDFEKCKNDDCEVHHDPKNDWEEYNRGEKDIHEVIRKIEDMLIQVDPKSDSIMEYDRLQYITSQMFHDKGCQHWDFWLYNGLIDYLGKKGRLRV